MTAGFVPVLFKVKNGIVLPPDVLVMPLTPPGMLVAVHVIIAPGVAEVMVTGAELDCEQMV